MNRVEQGRVIYHMLVFCMFWYLRIAPYNPKIRLWFIKRYSPLRAQNPTRDYFQDLKTFTEVTLNFAKKLARDKPQNTHLFKARL